jgi:pyruvate carboxylase subunit B
MRKNPLKITDTTLRDGHQSILATRLRGEDVFSMTPELDKAGFHSLEVWGGATFDVATRFLNEDPWDRLRTVKKMAPNTPLQMLLRGQSLVGYRHYADDVVTAFVQHTADCGMDIFRIFDALNDERNLETSHKAVKEAGKHSQLCICYSLTEPKMGGPVFTLDYFVKKALLFQDMGADSICVKDMAGILAPDDAFNLIQKLKGVLKVPVQLHTHHTSGMGMMSYWEAARAGVDVVDTALAPLALRSSQPAVEPLVAALRGTPRDPGLDMVKLLKLGDSLETILVKYRSMLNETRMSIVDTNVLVHQIPGGMISNLVMQLKQSKSLHRLNEVYAEVPRVRKEMGYPPLVTPLSQIVGAQAVQNVLAGRYKLVSTQLMDYCFGLYGRPPSPIDPDVKKMVLKYYKRGQDSVDVRPADLLPPEMEKAREAAKSISTDIGDILTAAIYPESGLRFLKWKYGLETPPPEVAPVTVQGK